MSVRGLSIEKVDSRDALLALRSEWRRLAMRCGGGLPFRTWEWHDAWCRHFSEQRGTLRDVPFVRAFRDHSGELVGVAPMMLTVRSPLASLSLRILDFVGADPNITELRGILSDPGWETEVYRSLLDHLSDCAGEWDWVCWRGIRAGSPGERLLVGRGARLAEEVPDYVLPLHGSWEEFKATRPRNVRESLRKCYNSLRRDGHSFDFSVATTPAAVAAALEHFFRLHGARAELRSTVPHPNVFAEAGARLFLSDVCEQLAATGEAAVFQLRVDGDLAASRVGFTVGRDLYLYYSGYDPRWARYGVMTTTLAETIRYAIGTGISSLNLSTGTDVSKTRWRPGRIDYRAAIQCGASLRGYLGHFTHRAITKRLVSPLVRDLAVRWVGRRPRFL